MPNVNELLDIARSEISNLDNGDFFCSEIYLRAMNGIEY